MITNGAKSLLAEHTRDPKRSKNFYWRSKEVITNGAMPLLAEHSSYPQRSNAFTGGPD